MDFGNTLRRIKTYSVVLIFCNKVSVSAFVLTRLILRFGRRVRVGLSGKKGQTHMNTDAKTPTSGIFSNYILQTRFHLPALCIWISNFIGRRRLPLAKVELLAFKKVPSVGVSATETWPLASQQQQ